MYTHYQGIDDLSRLTEAVSVSSAAYGSKSQLHNGNIAWRLRNLDLTGPAQSIAFWNRNKASLKSFAVVHDNRPADIQLLPEHVSDTQLMREMIAWIEQSRKNCNLKICCLSSNTALQTVLLDQGYIKNPISESYVRMERDLSRPISSSMLRAGYSMRHLKSTSPSKSFLRAHNEVFPNSKLTVMDYRRTFLGRSEMQDTRLVLVDPASAVVAFTLSWLDLKSECLEIEPVGCRKQWRRNGLSRHLLASAMKNAVRLGGKRATLTTRSSNEDAIKFYNSMEFEKTDVEYVFSKTFD